MVTPVSVARHHGVVYRVRAGEQWQQRWVGVNHSWRNGGHKTLWQNAHEAGQDNQVWLKMLDVFKQGGGPLIAVIKRTRANHKSWDSIELGVLQAIGRVVCSRCQNANRLQRVLSCVDQRLEV
jgi:hypothetical protein